MAFLEREHLTREQQVFAWWRIGQLAGGNFDRSLGETADFPLAKRAFVKVQEIAEDLISNETLGAARFYGGIPGDPHDRARRLAIAYRWSCTRTDAMVDQSATRINHNGYGINEQLMRGGMGMDTVPKKRAFLHSSLAECRETLSQRITREIRSNQDPKAIDTLLESLEDVAEPAVMKK